MPSPWLKFLLYIFFNVIGAIQFSRGIDSKPKISIRAGGATLPLEIYKVWKPVYQAYRSSFVRLDLSYAGVGSGDGIARFVSGQYDYAGSDAELSEKIYLEHPDFQMFPVMAGPVSLAYNIPEISSNCTDYTTAFTNDRCLRLSREVIVQIFSGEIKFWNHRRLVSLNPILKSVNKTITVIVRTDGSGTTGIFTSALQAFNPAWNGLRKSQFTDGCDGDGRPLKWNTGLKTQCASQSRGTSSAVINTIYSIAYMGPSDARDSNLPEAILQNKAGYWISPTVTSVQSAMDESSSQMGPRLTGPMVDTASNSSYPISGYTYILFRLKTMTNCTLATEMLRMFQFMLTDSLAQTVVRDMSKTPLSTDLYNIVKEQVFNQMECNGIKVYALLTQAMSIEDGTYDTWKLPVEVVLGLLLIAVLLTIGFFVFLKYQQNKHALRNTFLIDLDPKSESKGYTGRSSVSMAVTRSSLGKMEHWVEEAKGNGEVVRQANGIVFWVRDMCHHCRPHTVTWATRVQLVRFRDKVTHENVLRMIGVSEEDHIRWRIVTEYPAKGRLQDILRMNPYYMDTVFRNSIVSDVCAGMAYLHKNGIIHGQLTSRSCYVDSRWNVVVGDWEVYLLHASQKEIFVAFESLLGKIAEKDLKGNEKAIILGEYHRMLYWSAPEVIEVSQFYPDVFVVSNPTKAGDVYSYGVVFYETFTDSMPYDHLEDSHVSQPMSSYEIVGHIKAGDLVPVVPTETIHQHPVTHLVTSFWQFDPVKRPNFSEITRKLRQANPKQRGIVDSMMQAIEQYAFSLEEKVELRTIDLEKLTKNMEQLLHNMMPPSIADKLSRGEHVDPESYESCTVFFSDIVGFTSIAAQSEPMDIVLLLNDLYSAFDGVIAKFDVYKVETIGDSYMCVSGLPHRNGNSHADQIATMSLSILHTVMYMSVGHMPDQSLRVRIGVHSGRVMAGVVGIKMPRYCLFGDTVNTASRMESSSLPMRIQISSVTKALLDSFYGYNTCLRGSREIKGKGAMTTYWLTGKVDYDYSLPYFDINDDDRLLGMLADGQVK